MGVPNTSKAARATPFGVSVPLHVLSIALLALTLFSCARDPRAYPGSSVSLAKALDSFRIHLPKCHVEDLRYFASEDDKGSLDLRFDADAACVRQFLTELGAESYLTIAGSSVPFNTVYFTKTFGWQFDGNAMYQLYSGGPRDDVQYDIAVGPGDATDSLYLDAGVIDS